jgi:signal transduction histidine kinase
MEPTSHLTQALPACSKPLPTRVLLVEDEEAHAFLVRQAFQRSDHPFELAVAKNLQEARALLASSPPQLLIADFVLPDGRGVELLPVGRERAPFAVIVMTAHGDEQLAVDVMKAGALDYVVKTEASLTLMPRLAELALREWRHLEERRRAQEEREALLARERAARVEAERACRIRDEFLAMLSHELRTPLSAILGWTELLRSKERSPEFTRQALETIRRNARTQVALIDDLLEMSRIIAGRMRLEIQPVDLAGLVRAAVESARPTAEAKGVRLSLVLDFPHAAIPGDPNRLLQVAANLLSNAIKFTPGGGRVAVSLRASGGQAELEVRDTGIGIAPDFLPHLFERFRQADASNTRQYGGLGLGLAIVRQIVELHRGRVHAASAGVNRGAAFRVGLPLADPVQAFEQSAAREAAASMERSAPDPAGADLSGLRVLVVDDEQDALDLMRCVLEECHAEVEVASSVEAGYALFQERRPDILVSDIAMPREDGCELVRRVRALSPERGGAVPAVALTALAGEAERRRAIGAGFQRFVTKPIEPAKFPAELASLARG